MKKITICIGLAFMLLGLSCKNILDIKPENIIQYEDIFSGPSGVEAYMASMYNTLPIEDFNFRVTGLGLSFSSLTHLTDESMNTFNYDMPTLGEGISLSFWGYAQVRVVNDFIDKIQTSGLDPAKVQVWLGEAKFIRAYLYFAMVKRYGGVPIVTTVQTYNGNNLSELQVPRNTEQEVYDFIAKDLDEAIPLLSATTTNRSRANKYTAYALKSRAMLYAASIAKYGTVQLNGLLGIPATDANKYWQAAYDAANAIISDNKYSLYNRNPDKAQNYTDLFLATDNPEVIFARYFLLPSKGHSYDQAAVPLSLKGSAGFSSCYDPTVELAEQYEYINNPDGKLRLNDAMGNPIKYANPTDIFKDKDPRFTGTFIIPFSQWRGTTIDVQAGLFDGNLTTPITTSNYNTLYDPATKTLGTTGVRVIGANGIGGALIVSQTGFYIRKFLNPNLTPALVFSSGSDQQWIDFRLGEILLNYAEAAAELNKPADARIAMNKVRERAGISILTDADITVDRVRRERAVELAFENHRYWDLRRWRIGPSVIPPNTKLKAIFPYKVIDDNTWVFRTGPVGYAKTFDAKINYERIDPTEIAKNPKLIQNPLY